MSDRRKVCQRIAIYIVLILLVVVALFPCYWMVNTSLKHRIELFSDPPTLYPHQPTIDYYLSIFVHKAFGRQSINSLIVAIISTVIVIFIAILASYSLSRFTLPKNLNKHLSLWILSSRMFPPIVIALPFFLLMKGMHLLNTWWALILAYIGFNLPFAIWLIRGFFDEIPMEFEEAAMVDGASRLGAVFRITLPLALPGVITTAIFCFIFSWNEFLLALVLTTTSKSMTLPVATSTLVTQFQVNWSELAAAGTAAALPPLLFAIVVRRYLIHGITLGVLK